MLHVGFHRFAAAALVARVRATDYCLLSVFPGRR